MRENGVADLKAVEHMMLLLRVGIVGRHHLTLPEPGASWASWDSWDSWVRKLGKLGTTNAVRRTTLAAGRSHSSLRARKMCKDRSQTAMTAAWERAQCAETAP
eukprot:363417-Chlamydomonas_euryale.AAC.6